MLTTVRQTAVLVQVWTLAMTVWLLAVASAATASPAGADRSADVRLQDSPAKDTVAFVWAGGAVAIVVGGVLWLMWRKCQYIKAMERVDATAP